MKYLKKGEYIFEYFSENRPTCIDFDYDKAKAIENFKAILSALNEKPSEN